MPPLIETLILGAYVFAAGAYYFGYKILMLVFELKLLVTNHFRHEVDDLADRIKRLEDR